MIRPATPLITPQRPSLTGRILNRLPRPIRRFVNMLVVLFAVIGGGSPTMGVIALSAVVAAGTGCFTSELIDNAPNGPVAADAQAGEQAADSPRPDGPRPDGPPTPDARGDATRTDGPPRTPDARGEGLSPDAKQADASADARSDLPKTDTTRPDATRPDATRPDATQPDATQPDATRPDTTRPDATRPDATRPDATRPDTTKPDTVPPCTTKTVSWGKSGTFKFSTSTGNPSQVDTYNNTLSLQKNVICTYLYDPAKGKLPSSSGWTANAPKGWASPPKVIGGKLPLSSIGKDTIARWENKTVPLLSSSRGWIAQWSVKPTSVEISSSTELPLGFSVSDGVRLVRIKMNGTIFELGSPTLSAPFGFGSTHTVRLVVKGFDFSLFVDNSIPDYHKPKPSINGKGKLGSLGSGGYIYWHDGAGKPDAAAEWGKVCVYAGGIEFPYYGSGGFFTNPLNATAGTTIKNIGLKWTGTQPTGTSLRFDVYASDNITKPTGRCAIITAKPGSSGTLSVPAACDNKKRLWFTLNHLADPTKKITPSLTDFTVTRKDCK